MPSKYQIITELAVSTARDITSSAGKYMAFLTTAANNFKYSFRDQLLIYAQKPDATACAEIDFWNKHGRYVNKGTRGIALLVDTTEKYKLRHVFDMSDTNSRAGRTVPVWSMQPHYAEAVIDTLENSFGDIEDKSSLAAALIGAASLVVEDNFTDYYNDLLAVKTGSLLEELDELNTEVWLKDTLKNSVAYMMLTRCGYRAGDYFSAEDFARVYDFDTPETLSVLGAATSDIAEMALREIATTVLSLQKQEYRQNRTFAGDDRGQYDIAERKNDERSTDHGSHIQNRGRLSAAQSDRTGGSDGREIWDAAAQLPPQPQERELHRDAAVREAEQPSGGDQPTGQRDAGEPDYADGAEPGRDGEPESLGSDEMGGADEQHPGLGGGGRAEGTDLRLTPEEPAPLSALEMQMRGPTGLEVKHHDFDARTDIAHYHEDTEKNELLRISDALKNHRVEIAAFFAEHEDSKERGDFIKAFFDNTFVEKILSNGQRAGYRAWDDVLNFWRGSYLSREKEVFMRWEAVAGSIYGMMLLDQWLDPDERALPSVAEQMTFIEQAEQEKGSAFVLPQEAIDYVLCNGSGVSEGKYRIYEQFLKKQDKQENIKFLKEEYGWGGHSDAIPGSGYSEMHDTKGISISRKGWGADPQDTYLLRWTAVEKRIGELIAADRYLSRTDKEKYPAYRAAREIREARGKISEEFRSIVADYKDFVQQIGEQDKLVDRWYPVSCASSFVIGDKKMHARVSEGDFILPMMRDAMQTIIGENTHLTQRCEAMLEALQSDLAKPMEPTFDELNPPPEPEKEYVLILGDTVHLGAQEYEILAYDDTEVRLYDPSFPLFNQVMPIEEFHRKLADNPQNDHLLQVVEPAPEQVEPDTKPADLDSAKELINAYCMEIFESEADFSDLSHVDLAFGATEDSEHTVEIYADLVNFRLCYQVDGAEVASIQCAGFHDLNQFLANLDFDEMVAFAEEQYRLEQQKESVVAEVPQQTESATERIAPRYLVVAYHHIENGFDEKLDYQTLQEAEQAAQGYVDGTMEPDGFAFDGAAVYDQQEKKYIRIFGDYPDEKAHAQVAAPAADAIPESTPDTGVETIARYHTDGETILIQQYPNGQYYIHYCYADQNDAVYATAGDFATFEEAEKTMYSHRPQAEKVPEQMPEPLAPPAPRPRAKVAPTVLHPEIPSAERRNYRITDDAIGVGTPGERFANNVRAIRLLKRLESENRLATPDEQEVLAKYVGWGGLADCFDERHSKYAELKSLLTEDEYEAARESTLTAFYTPPVVIRAMYQALENMNFKTGNVLEPSCGIGNFIGMQPESLSDSKIYGVELDSISGRITQQLYQNSSIAVQGFEKTDLPDSFFDVAIGNIPFGSFKVSDKRYDKHNFLIHDYFFARTLDKVRPGGIVAFITSKGTMDKETASVRKYIAQRAELLGAIRLPNDTFKSAAGTEVTSDILFFQKRDRLTEVVPNWVYLGTDENGLKMNQYFIDNPHMVMGEMLEVSGPYGPETACLPREGQELGALLSEAVQNIQAEIPEYEMDDPEAEEDRSIPADPNTRNFSFTVVDGTLYYRENSRMNPVEASATAESRIRGMVEIRDCVRNLIEYQTEDYPDSYITKAQAELNDLYDAFCKKYGRINSRANSTAFHADSSYFLLSSLEVLDDERNFVRKADMFTKRTIRQRSIVTSVDTASEALALSLAEKAKVDMPYMMELTGKTEQEIFSDLTGVIFLNPMHTNENDGRPKHLPADEYLSGNVREKLEWARRSAELYPEDYAANVRALEAVQPQDLTASEISVRLGATWLPEDVVNSFMYELFSTPYYARRSIQVHFSNYTGEWNVEGKSQDRGNVKAHNTYGTGRINGYKIIEETLNLRDVRIFDYVEDEHGNRVPVLNKKETAIAQGKQELVKQAFQDWIWKDHERRERLCKLYNEKFNSARPREYDGSHLNFVGMNPEITLRPHQVNAIAHILYGGNTLLAHVVGAGKTFEMVAAAQESKRLGLCHKSLFVVPNHLTEQWAAEYLQLYPSANILVATRKDFEAKNRKRFCGRIATGDYDAIIIGHSQFEKIPMSVGSQRFYLMQQYDEVLNGITELKANKGDRFSVKQLERTKKSIQAKLDKLNDQSRKDDLVTFEELGVDRIFIDEAHYYKNLAAFSKMRNVGGISQTEAQKSSDLYMKCRYLDELTGGRGVIFATGTPISNTMVEMYTMQKYLQYGTLKRNDLIHFDAWASTFGETVTAIELAPEGSGYRAKTRFAKFYNLPELMTMFKEVADIQTADMLNLPVPKANYHNIVLKPSEHQKEMVASLSERAERVRNRMVDSSTDNMLLITNDGRKLALDQRLINPMLPDSDTGKVSACADNVFEIWQRTAEQRSTQMVFCDLSTPHNDGKFNVYDDLRAKLIAKGIPAEEIAFIHSANTETQKKEMFGKVRSGQIRVLLGSTQKMGAGTNVQKKLIALHHLDCPWRPSDLQQREGRIIRQGNDNPEVDIYTYVTENTFDSYLYQLVEGKQKFIGQVMTSKSPVRSAEDIDETALSYAEIKALCTGNPYIKEKMDLDIAVQRLKLLKANHLSQRYALEDQIIKVFPQKIAAYEQRIEGYKADMAHLEAHTQPNEDGFSPMEIEGTVHTDKKAAGSAILAACKALTSPDAVPLGQYRGFSMDLSFDTMQRTFTITLKNELRHTVSLGTDILGNVQRLDNALAGLGTTLKACEDQLADTRVQFANAKVAVEQPFPQEDELKTKTARLDELNILLNLDKRENEIVDGERDEDEPPERSTRETEWER